MGITNLNQSDTGPESPSAQINTTPLIDVLLVLLIMLIITIPAQLHSVNLSSARAQPSTPLPVEVRLYVRADGTVLWDGQALDSRDSLLLRLQQVQATQPQLLVSAAPQAPYQAVAHVLASAQRLGLRRLSVVGARESP